MLSSTVRNVFYEHLVFGLRKLFLVFSLILANYSVCKVTISAFFKNSAFVALTSFTSLISLISSVCFISFDINMSLGLAFGLFAAALIALMIHIYGYVNMPKGWLVVWGTNWKRLILLFSFASSAVSGVEIVVCDGLVLGAPVDTRMLTSDRVMQKWYYKLPNGEDVETPANISKCVLKVFSNPIGLDRVDYTLKYLAEGRKRSIRGSSFINEYTDLNQTYRSLFYKGEDQNYELLQCSNWIELLQIISGRLITEGSKVYVGYKERILDIEISGVCKLIKFFSSQLISDDDVRHYLDTTFDGSESSFVTLLHYVKEIFSSQRDGGTFGEFLHRYILKSVVSKLHDQPDFMQFILNKVLLGSFGILADTAEHIKEKCLIFLLHHFEKIDPRVFLGNMDKKQFFAYLTSYSFRTPPCCDAKRLFLGKRQYASCKIKKFKEKDLRQTLSQIIENLSVIKHDSVYFASAQHNIDFLNRQNTRLREYYTNRTCQNVAIATTGCVYLSSVVVISLYYPTVWPVILPLGIVLLGATLLGTRLWTDSLFIVDKGWAVLEESSSLQPTDVSILLDF